MSAIHGRRLAAVLLGGVLALGSPLRGSEAGGEPAPDLAAVRARVAEAGRRARAAARLDGERAVVEADLAFAAEAARRPVAEAFADRFLADGILFGARSPLAVGPEAVRAALAGDASHWEWAPFDVAVDGDLGVTRGVAVIWWEAGEAGPGFVTTRYVTVWKRGADGAWRIWADAGTPGPLPELPVAAAGAGGD